MHQGILMHVLFLSSHQDAFTQALLFHVRINTNGLLISSFSCVRTYVLIASVLLQHCIVNRQLEKLVAESDPKTWKETLAILCTYATSEEFAALCDALAERLKTVGKDEKSATLCYICAGNVNRTVQIWMEQQARSSGSFTSKLQDLMEKICVVLVLDVCKQETVPDIVGEKYSQFAELLVSQGKLFQGNQYLVRANAAATLSAAICKCDDNRYLILANAAATLSAAVWKG